MDYFRAALDKTMKNEGIFSDNPRDAGGKTFKGISRAYWPSWPGWTIVDRWLKEKDDDILALSGIEGLVATFYRVNFWERIQGDKLAAIDADVAYEVFDSAVNLDVPDSVRFLQTALNMQRLRTRAYSQLIVDGLLGHQTMRALSIYLSTQPGDPEENKKILLNCLNGEQYIHYKNNPQHVYFRGWFLRV